MARSSSSWKPGTSGNPAGMRKGTKQRRSILLQELEKDGSALAIAIKTAALTDGDVGAMSLWLTRLESAVRARGEMIQIELDVNAPVEDQIKTIMQAIIDS